MLDRLASTVGCPTVVYPMTSKEPQALIDFLNEVWIGQYFSSTKVTLDDFEPFTISDGQRHIGLLGKNLTEHSRLRSLLVIIVPAIWPGNTPLNPSEFPFSAMGDEYELTISNHANPTFIVHSHGSTTLIPFNMVYSFVSRMTAGTNPRPMVEFSIVGHPKMDTIRIHCSTIEEAGDLVALMHTHILQRSGKVEHIG